MSTRETSASSNLCVFSAAFATNRSKTVVFQVRLHVPSEGIHLAHPRHEKGAFGVAEVAVAGEVVAGETGDGVEVAGRDDAWVAECAAAEIGKLHALVLPESFNQQGELGLIAFPHGLAGRAAPALQGVGAVAPGLDGKGLGFGRLQIGDDAGRRRKGNESDEVEEGTAVHGRSRCGHGSRPVSGDDSTRAGTPSGPPRMFFVLPMRASEPARLPPPPPPRGVPAERGLRRGVHWRVRVAGCRRGC